MCIFSSNTIVETTKVFAGVLSPTRRLMGYENSVTTGKGGSVMMLPIPATGQVVFHDTTPYKSFLSEISEAVVKKELEGTRGGLLSKSFSTVGIYQMKMVQPSDVVSTLIELKQPVQKWVYEMVSSYTGYQWLFVIIPEGAKISSQPLLVEFEQTVRPGDLYFPLMDVHGDEEVAATANRNHILSIGDAQFTTDDTVLLEIQNFPWSNLKYSGTTLGLFGSSNYKNGDVWGTLEVSEEDPNLWNLDFYTPYPLPVKNGI